MPAQAPRAFSTIVLGGGLVGSALAYHLTQAGETGILLYDKTLPAAGASGKGAGILCSQCWNRWDTRVVEETRREYEQLAAAWKPIIFAKNGSLRTVTTAAGETLLETRRRELQAEGVPAEILGPEAMAARVPSAQFSDVRAGLHTPNDAVIYPAEMVYIYEELAQKAGATIEFDFGPPAMRATSRGWRVETRYGVATAERLVLACGAWTKRVLQDLGHPLPLAPYRTQACVLKTEAPVPLLPSVHDTELDVYTRPYFAGHLLAGDGTELVEADPERSNPAGDPRFLEHIAESFAHRFPGWAGASVLGAWAGVCTSTPDRHPVVGAVPGSSNLYVASGFNGFGVMRAGAIARRLARALHGDPWSSLAPADPARFPRRDLVFTPQPGFTLEDPYVPGP